MFAVGDDRASRMDMRGQGVMRAFVLPRPLRRASRFAGALASGRIDMPRHIGLVGLVALFAATAGYGMVLGGHTRSTMEGTTSAFGFAVNKVDVTGNDETSDIDVLQQLQLDGDTSLLTMSVASARKALMQLPWVRDAEVRKVYPGALAVKLDERKAFAIWQHGDELSLIERSGSVIVPFNPGKFSSLPLVVGLGAETQAAGFEQVLDRWPDLAKRVRAAIRVGDRRWNLVFDNGITAKLPAGDVAQSLEDLSVMERERSILSRDIVAVDLRLKDRITVQMSPEAASRRHEMIAVRDKAIRKAEKQTYVVNGKEKPV